MGFQQVDGVLMAPFEAEYINWRWNRRVAMISAGSSLALPLVGLALTGEGPWLIDAIIISAGLGVATFVYGRYRRISVAVLGDTIRVRNAWRTVSVPKASVERMTARALYGVACPVLHVRSGGRLNKVPVTALPFPDATVLDLPVPSSYDL